MSDCTEPYLKIRSPILWSLPILAIGVFTQWLRPFRPGFDDAYAIEAAWRFANGGFMGHSWHDQLADLSQPTLTWLGVDWPPGFALLVAAGLKFGWSVATSVQTLQLSFGVIGIVGWLNLANGTLSRAAMAIFIGWVMVLFFANEASVTNLIFWSLVPWIMLQLLRTDAANFQLAALYGGLLIAVCLTFRYSSLYLAPACLTWVVLQRDLSWRQKWQSGLYLALPGTLVLVCLIALNQSFGGAAAFTENYQKGLYFGALFDSAAPLKAIFANGLGLEFVLERLLARFPGAFNLLLAVVLFSGMIVGAVRAPSANVSSVQLKTIQLTVCLFAWLVLMLGALTVRHGSMDSWTFLGHERYYSDLLPAIALGWLFVLQHLLVPMRWWKGVVIGIACVMAISMMTIRHVGGGQRLMAIISGQPSIYDIDTISEQVDQLILGAHANEAIVLFDDAMARFPQWERHVQIRQWPSLDQLRQVGSSKPVTVIAVAPAVEQLSASKQASIELFGLQPISSGQRGTETVILYSAAVDPNQLSSQ